MARLNLTSGNQTVSVVASDLATSILQEIDVVAGSEVASGNDLTWVLENLQRRIDLINADRRLIYAETFPVFTLLTNTQPIEIGPTVPAGHFVMSQPPIRIADASLLLTVGGGGGNGTVEVPILVLDENQWADVSIKNLTSTLCTAVYYERQFPNGNLFFWPIPTQENQVRLRTWVNLPQVLQASTSLALPPGYWMYLLCAVASDVAPSFGAPALQRIGSQPFIVKYREARNAIVDNNKSVPPLVSDAPQSRKGSSIPDYNFLTGWRRGM